MNATRPFYSHEPDDKIMIKKDQLEIGNWTDDLEYINEELEYLLDIEDRIINNAQLYQNLHEIRRENQLRLGELYRYEGNIRNARECDTAACDAFYLYNHEKTRTNYMAHLKKYRSIKSKIFSQILQNRD
ncbi:hypothetical protein ACFQZJ_17000 [Maribacter chungangensis]|uniref:Tetratricopeptide repeat protein n=1 Tax=Maribacter chungangensis TaxID=1069117 RepID=A0ABW3B8B8_9FLAO